MYESETITGQSKKIRHGIFIGTVFNIPLLCQLEVKLLNFLPALDGTNETWLWGSLPVKTDLRNIQNIFKY